MLSAGEHSCQICFGQQHSTVLLPRGHGGLCWDCGLQAYAMTEECPFCRSKVEVVSAEGAISANTARLPSLTMLCPFVALRYSALGLPFPVPILFPAPTSRDDS